MLRWPPLVGFVEGWEGRERATDSFDSSKSLPFHSDFSNHISFDFENENEDERVEEQMIRGRYGCDNYTFSLLYLFFALFITLKERLCSEIGYTQPQDGNFVEF